MLLTLVLAFLASGAFAAQSYKLSDSPSGVTLLDQDQTGLTMRLDVGEVLFTPVLTKEGSFTMLSVKGLARSFDNVGEPNLPMAHRLFVIPFGCELTTEVISYEVEEISLADLGLEDPVIPAQPPMSKSDDPALVPFHYDQTAYGKSGYYKLPLAEANVSGVMRGVRMGRMSMTPVEYDPVEHKIKVYKNVTVRVDYVDADWQTTEETYKNSYSPFFEPVYDRLLNHNALFSGVRDDLVNYPVKLLIISDRMFEAQLQPFIEWKTKKGFIVEVGYTDTIGTSTTAIKACIKGHYDSAIPPSNPKPSFVLLVGDDQQIPAWDGISGHITDLKYFEYTGDYHPEMYYGRFSAQTPALLQPQIDKTLEYEKYEMPDPSYLGEVTMIAGVDGTYAITHGNGQINYGTNLYFNAAHGIYSNTWLYPASAGAGVAAAIIQTVEDGIGYINYTAHCGHDSWGNPEFDTDDIEDLSNIHKYGLAVGNCCLPNTFGSSYGTPCWGEVWLQEEDKGGIGFIGATDNTQWDPDYYWGVGAGPIIGAGPTYEQTTMGAYDGIFHDHGEPVSEHYITNDAIIYVGNLAVEEGAPSSTQYYWEAYMLMGDPSVMTYLGIPSENNITHPATIFVTDASVTVEADPASYVGITVDGVLYGAGYVNETGLVAIDLAEFADPCTANIVVCGQNKIPYQSTIDVITPEGPYVVYDESVIDDAAGNANGDVDAGESIVLGVQLINMGPDDAYDVSATLSTTDLDITITDDTESYGTITGGDGTGYSVDAFAFDVSPSISDGQVVRFDVLASGNDRLEWESGFNVTVHAPVVEFLSVSIDDASGNGNGILDPGETADIVVSVSNSGSCSATTVTGTLSESDSYLSISDDTGYYGNILAGGGVASNSGDVFVVSADAGCPMGYAVLMMLDLAGDLSFTKTIGVMITVGDRVAFFYDDFSYNQGWTGLGGSAEWTIGPCIGSGGDPSNDTSPTTDKQVLGNDLTTSGEYNSGISGTQWVTSRLIDCADYTGIQMRFQRWLGVEKSQYDHVYFEVFNGVSWATLYENPNETFEETAWGEQFFDVSALADGNPDFQIRFGLGGTDGSGQYCGWNIDDIELMGYYQGSGGMPNMSVDPLAVYDSLVEGATGYETVRVNNNGDGELRIRFSPGDDWIECSTDLNAVPGQDYLDFGFTVNTTGMEPGNHSGSLMFTSNDPSSITGSIPANVYIHAPDLVITELAVADSLVEGETAQHEVMVNNPGLGRLHVAFSTSDGWLSCSTVDNIVEPGDSLGFPININSEGMDPGDHVGTVSYTSNDPGDPSGEIAVNLHVRIPVFVITQSSIDVSLANMEQTSVPLVIENDGPGRLNYTVGYSMFDMLAAKSTDGSQLSLDAEPIGFRIADPDKTGVQEPYYAPEGKGSGGPDDYGYRWIDSDEAGGPIFGWVDISGTGTAVILDDDDYAGPIPIGFGFPLYDNVYTELYICSNGLLTFGEGTIKTTNTDLPEIATPNNLIAIWWDDLNAEEYGDIYYEYDGVNERFIVSFVGVPNYLSGSATGSLTFQVLIYPSGRIELQYDSMDPGDDPTGLAGATIGIENIDGTDGLAVVYNAEYMHDQLAITMASSAWLSVSHMVGSVDPFSSDQVDVIFKSGELDYGTYTGQVGVSTNDPVMPSAVVPVSLTIEDQSFICGDANDDTEVDIDDVTFLIAYIFSGGPPPANPEAADPDCSGDIDIDDVTYLVSYIFLDGPEPCADCP